jgi:fructose-bisphosphate aldolase, class I
MRSVINQPNAAGIKSVVNQQFEIAAQILAAGLMPIVEPEVDIHCPEKRKAETLLKGALLEELGKLPVGRWSCSRSRCRSRTTFTLIASDIQMF